MAKALNISNILEGNCWSVICQNDNNGDDASISWIVVGYFQAKPYARVIGVACEFKGVKGAVEDALNTIKDDAYASLGKYEPQYN